MGLDGARLERQVGSEGSMTPGNPGRPSISPWLWGPRVMSTVPDLQSLGVSPNWSFLLQSLPMTSALATLMIFSLRTTRPPAKRLSHNVSSCARPIHSFHPHFPVPAMCQELCFPTEGSQATVKSFPAEMDVAQFESSGNLK